MLDLLSDLEEENAFDIVEGISNLQVKERVITKSFFTTKLEDIRRVVNTRSKGILEKFFFNLGYARPEDVEKEVDEDFEEVDEGGKVKILSSLVIPPRAIQVKDFVKHFRGRYNQIRDVLLSGRLDNLTSLGKIGNDRDNFTVIVSILEKRITKNKNLMFKVEDLTGSTRILINNNKKELFDQAREILLDDVVAFKVSGNSEWLYANELIFPDSFLAEKKSYKNEEIVAFISDLNIRSKDR